MSTHSVRRNVLAFTLLLPSLAVAQIEPLSGVGIGGDTQLVYPHFALPGAIGIDFSLDIGFAPLYPPGESHTVVVTFEWGPTATGPWTVSPDHVNTVPGGMTDFFSTGVFHGPADAPFVAVHFYAGGLMIGSGTFTHVSVVPEPHPAALMAIGLLAVGLFAASTYRRKRRS